MTIYAVIERETGHGVSDETPLDTLDVDSLELLDLLLAIENDTGLSVPTERLGELHTVGDIIRIGAA